MSIEELNLVREKYHTEANRYIANAKETLQKTVKEDRFYKDEKYVKTACGIAYNGVLKALDGYFLLKGIPKPKARKSIEYYEETLTMLDKKLLRDLDSAYKILHLSGYDDGVTSVPVVMEGFNIAARIVKRLES